MAEPIYEPCVQCGYCCKKYACGYGHYDEDVGQCIYLTKDLKCAKYDVIVEYEQDHQYPMFDNYCSQSLFNDVRSAKIATLSRSERTQVRIQEFRAAIYRFRDIDVEDSVLNKAVLEGMKSMVETLEAELEETDDG